MFFRILGSKGENVDNDDPTGLDVLGFSSTHIGDCHHNKLFHFESSVEVIQHNGFKRLQEIFLEIVMTKLIFQ